MQQVTKAECNTVATRLEARGNFTLSGRALRGDPVAVDLGGWL